MAQTYKKLNIDINTKPTDIIAAVQADALSRYLDIALSDNGVALNLTGHEVRIYGKKPDGTEFYNNGTITSATTGRCQFELTSQALSAVGIVEVQILLFKDDTQILSTQPFNINVVKSLMSDTAVESSNEYGALVVLFQNLYEAFDLMTEMVQKIGVPETVAQSLGLDTMFEVWDWLITYLQANSSAGIVSTVNTINTNTTVNNTASKTGILSQKAAYIIALLENATYGLSALKTALTGGSVPVVKSSQRGRVDITVDIKPPATSPKDEVGYYLDVTVNTFNINKAFLLWQTYVYNEYVASEIINSNTIRVWITSYGGTYSTEAKFRGKWQLIEFY